MGWLGGKINVGNGTSFMSVGIYKGQCMWIINNHTEENDVIFTPLFDTRYK